MKVGGNATLMDHIMLSCDSEIERKRGRKRERERQIDGGKNIPHRLCRQHQTFEMISKLGAGSGDWE